jgi:hypothetical protein
MSDLSQVIVERMVDDGRRFDPGTRVDYFQTSTAPHDQVLEKAALGSYVVLGCTSSGAADGVRWLDIRLQRVIPG